MAVEVVSNSPLAKALQDVVGPKLVEVGWSSGMQDDTLSEYIILMLVNGKSQDQIASELSHDLLDLGPEDQSATEFSRWLFEQVDLTNAQLNGTSSNNVAFVAGDLGQDAQMVEDSTNMSLDADMVDSTEASQPKIPTGPKNMRGGNPRNGNNRMFNQINKALDRSSDASLHRIRGASSSRINSHSSREPPKGPRGQQIQRNLAGAQNRAMQNMGMMGQPGFGGPIQDPAAQQQQMQILRMFEEQAKMMAQMAAQQGFAAPDFGQNMNQQRQGNGKSLFSRIDGKGQNRRDRGRPQQRGNPQVAQDTAMAEDGAPGASGGVDGETQDPAQTMCRFNTQCTKPDCAFAHQTPAAPPGVPVDTSSECTFGVACKNRKCVSRHPSPAKILEHQQQQDCKYGPSCTNPYCTFKHPEMPACRNGADCTAPGCKFYHSKIACKFTPCRNARCPYKHAEGQKEAGVSGHVWQAGDEKKEHISERKFVADEGQEEVIIPGAQSMEVTEGVVS